MEIVLKEFKGYSGSKVFLIKDFDKIFIRKIDNVERNYERLSALYELGYNVPKIYRKEDNILDMEYISGLDFKTYILHYHIDEFLKNVYQLINRLNFEINEKCYVDVYVQKLKWLKDDNTFSFTKKQLIDSLPRTLPSSCYHGDLTLENMIYRNNKLYLIDSMTSEYDSWVFDLAKMRQDLKCFWFVRNYEDKNIKKSLTIIDEKLLEKYPIVNNNSLLILMLLRVFPYVNPHSKDKKFLINEINQLWK